MNDLSIIIPVHGAIDYVERCLSSVLASDAGSARILVVDDGSKSDDSLRLQRFCETLASVELLQNFRNRGYTRSISYALSRVETPFVCILNSDTLVPQAWAGPLVDLLKGNPYLAAVGPLSNAASYQSVPLLHDPDGGFAANPKFGSEAAQRENLVRLTAHLFGDVLIDMPILNGFCTVFRSKALQDAGGFDVQAFPMGYGEENDLFIRLSSRGWRAAVAAGSFVYHAKSMSFGSARRSKLAADGSEVLKARYSASRMKNLSRLMDQNWQMANIRMLLDSLQPGLGDVATADETPSRMAANQPIGARLELGMLRGPVEIDVSGDTISLRGAENVSRTSMSLKADGVLRIRLPDDLAVPVSTSAFLETAICRLAMQAGTDDVLVTEWEVPLKRPDWLRVVCKYRFGALVYDGQPADQKLHRSA